MYWHWPSLQRNILCMLHKNENIQLRFLVPSHHKVDPILRDASEDIIYQRNSYCRLLVCQCTTSIH